MENNSAVNMNVSPAANTGGKRDYFVVDIAHIFKTIWQHIHIVVIVSLLTAAIGFAIAAFFIAPTYSSSIMLYVNNHAFSLEDVGVKLSSSDITAAQSLVKTYSVLLKNRTTLEEVIDTADLTYKWEDLNGMITASSVNETQVMKVTVTCKDPYEAEKIANCIAKVLPRCVTEIVEGTSMEVVDAATVNLQKVAPSLAEYTTVGFILGMLATLAVLLVMALADGTVHDEDYVLQNYRYPVLAKIPDLLDDGGSKYSKYNRYYRSTK